MKIFKERKSKDSYLVLNGNHVINGEWDIEKESENVAIIRGSDESMKDIPWYNYKPTVYYDYVCDVPTRINGWRSDLEWFHINEEKIKK